MWHPDFASEVSVLVEERPSLEDEAFTAQTINRMRQYAARAASLSIVQDAARCATATASTPAEMAQGIWRWIRNRVRFRPDAELAAPIAAEPESAEVLIPPEHLLRMPVSSGDCDDFSMLTAAMLIAVGIRCCFRTVAANARDDRYSHVYVMALLPGGPMALDCSHGPYAGWEVPRTGKTKDWPIEEHMPQLGAINWSNILTDSFKTAGSILSNRFGQPNIAPGTFVDQQRGILFRQQPGASALAFPGVNVGGDSSLSTMLLLGAAVVVAVLAVKK